MLAVVTLSATACQKGRGPVVDIIDLGAAPHEVLPAAPITEGASIYDLPMKLETHEGKTVALDVYRGQPVVISMFYGSCKAACPLLISDVKRLLAKLPDKTRRQVRLMLVSFDPDGDDVAHLKELVTTHGLDALGSDRLTVARTDADRVRELAAVLGIKYRKFPDGSFSHSSVISLLDRDGRIAARIEGLNRASDPIVDALAAMESR